MPEHDQNSLIELTRTGWIETVQVIYDIFEQEPASEFLPTATDSNGLSARGKKVGQDLKGSGLTLPQAALKFVLARPGVSVTIPGMRTVSQAEAQILRRDDVAVPCRLLRAEDAGG